jgi:hypothetical protein
MCDKPRPGILRSVVIKTLCDDRIISFESLREYAPALIAFIDAEIPTANGLESNRSDFGIPEPITCSQAPID